MSFARALPEIRKRVAEDLKLPGLPREKEGSKVTFEFRGKSGKRHKIAVSDRRLAKIVGKCQDLPGQQLFEYVYPDGKIVEI
jgi:DNA topoisomerase-1